MATKKEAPITKKHVPAKAVVNDERAQAVRQDHNANVTDASKEIYEQGVANVAPLQEDGVTPVNEAYMPSQIINDLPEDLPHAVARNEEEKAAIDERQHEEAGGPVEQGSTFAVDSWNPEHPEADTHAPDYVESGDNDYVTSDPHDIEQSAEDQVPTKADEKAAQKANEENGVTHVFAASAEDTELKATLDDIRFVFCDSFGQEFVVNPDGTKEVRVEGFPESEYRAPEQWQYLERPITLNGNVYSYVNPNGRRYDK